jgi:penicillin-binding protein 2
MDLLFKDKTKPTVSRTYQFQYPPGSVFKVLLAIAALEEGAITEHTTYSCSGQFHLPGVKRPWKCWRLKYGGHGGVSVVDALAYSCDVFFYNVGRDLGAEKIKEWSSKLGLGVETGIDLPQEVVGLIPDPEWKKREAEKAGKTEPWEFKWYPGETVNMSIGQGAVTTTPLQNAVLMAAVLNGGRRVTPYLNMELGPRVTEPLVSEKTLQIVIAGLRKCVERDKPAPTGTGKLAKIEGLDVLGKTGTAQVAALHHVSGLKEEDIPYELRDHALFISGVTDREPRIAVSIMIEHGLHGSSAAAPIAKEIFEYFYMNSSTDSTYTDTPRPISVAQREVGE